MIKLTDTQMKVLASACARPDGMATRPHALNRAAAVKVAARMIEELLVVEAPAKLDAPIWRMDDQARAFSLKITKLGRALVRDGEPSTSAGDPPVKEIACSNLTPNVGEAVSGPMDGRGRPGSKRSLILALMQRQEGATIADLMAATGWLPHTTRAALTGLRKGGLSIIRERDSQADASVYRIEPFTVSAAA